MIDSRRIVLTAMPFGYGPAAKALAIAAELRRLGAAAAFVGSGIAYELATRSRSVFSDVVDGAKAPRRARSMVGSSSNVVSVMDRESAALARRLSKPFDVVDSLLWMRDRVPPPLDAARRYWAQRLDGLRWRLPSDSTTPLSVGPIITPRSNVDRRPTATRKIVVNIGGCESPQGDRGVQAYSQFVIKHLLDAGTLCHGSETLVMGGARCIRRLSRRFGSRDVRFASLSHVEALGEFASADQVWTSPGLTASLECFQLAVPTLFLPPENYSQWCILRAFRHRGLAPSAFHWEDMLPGQPLRNRLPEAQRNPVVQGAIRELSADEGTARAYRRQVRRMADLKLSALAQRQRAFLLGLGPNGATTIAESLVREGVTAEPANVS